MALNIPLGTYFEDGVRSGPIYSSRISAGLVADINGVITSSDYSTYGPAILLSPQNTYNITPSPPGTGAGNSILNNIVATTGDNAVPAATYLTLRGDNASTYYTTGANGFPFVQLDWPRVVTVTITGANATADTRVTILGYDYYGFPMQYTYVVEAQQTYPIVTVATVDAVGTISLPCKAFYQVTGVYVNAALPNNCLLSVGAADVFGLPYVVNGIGTISSISWGTQQAGGIPNNNAIVPASDMTIAPSLVYNSRFDVLGAFAPADKTFPATATTGDVRGLYAVSTPASAQTIATVDVDWKKLIFTSYIEGADTWINQVAAKQQQYRQQTGNLPPLLPQGIAISPQEPADLYGVSQFYTGVPS